MKKYVLLSIVAIVPCCILAAQGMTRVEIGNSNNVSLVFVNYDTVEFNFGLDRQNMRSFVTITGNSQGNKVMVTYYFNIRHGWYNPRPNWEAELNDALASKSFTVSYDGLHAYYTDQRGNQPGWFTSVDNPIVFNNVAGLEISYIHNNMVNRVAINLNEHNEASRYQGAVYEFGN